MVPQETVCRRGAWELGLPGSMSVHMNEIPVGVGTEPGQEEKWNRLWTRGQGRDHSGTLRTPRILNLPTLDFQFALKIYLSR